MFPISDENWRVRKSERARCAVSGALESDPIRPPSRQHRAAIHIVLVADSVDMGNVSRR